MSVGFDGDQGVGIVFFACHFQQVAGVLQPGVNRRQGIDDGFEGFFLFAEVLGALGVIPDFGIFEFGVDLLEFL